MEAGATSFEVSALVGGHVREVVLRQGPAILMSTVVCRMLENYCAIRPLGANAFTASVYQYLNED